MFLKNGIFQLVNFEIFSDHMSQEAKVTDDRL